MHRHPEFQSILHWLKFGLGFHLNLVPLSKRCAHKPMQCRSCLVSHIDFSVEDLMPAAPECEWASGAALIKLALFSGIRCLSAECQVINNAALLAFVAIVYRVIVPGRSSWTKRTFTMASVNNGRTGIKCRSL